MTPREIAGCLHFAVRRQRREAADRLVLATLAARGEKKDVDASLDALNGDDG